MGVVNTEVRGGVNTEVRGGVLTQKSEVGTQRSYKTLLTDRSTWTPLESDCLDKRFLLYMSNSHRTNQHL